MINKKDLFAEFNSTEGKKFREANQLIRSFLKNSGLEMDTDNMVAQFMHQITRKNLKEN